AISSLTTVHFARFHSTMHVNYGPGGQCAFNWDDVVHSTNGMATMTNMRANLPIKFRELASLRWLAVRTERVSRMTLRHCHWSLLARLCSNGDVKKWIG